MIKIYALLIVFFFFKYHFRLNPYLIATQRAGLLTSAIFPLPIPILFYWFLFFFWPPWVGSPLFYFYNR